MTRLLALIALAPALALSACSAPPAETDPAPRLARVETVRGAESASMREFVGRVEPRLSVDLAFQVGGRLSAFPVMEGQIVPEGTVIAQLDSTDFARAVRQAEVQRQQASQNLERQRILHERGIASDAALEQAQTEHDLQSVSLETARQNLRYATVNAPFQGLVSRRLVDNFTTVAAGQPVARLQDMSELRVAIQIPESIVAVVDQSQPADIHARFPFLPGQTFPLTFRELSAEPEPASRTYTAMFALPGDLPGNILPGMTATVMVSLDSLTGNAEPALVRAPAGALSAAPDGGFRVYIFDADAGIVREREVEVGPVGGDSVVIRHGLEPGEQIVTSGVSALYDGMRIRPMEGRNGLPAGR
ncbi:efflux RND transporter periplasmic adaptor subunit [Alkalicaulis satelles]|uniref:Efflux RND transporter periplasmic adaptor subunit n=1 Tax=Alkalicaulis satelles TaxID=2609175 RepID=A0A5M6ZEG6_9PROT|nr:efflux RND transporter periplasmic adaptor subunit [Alkalicaulis satelles]KAA5802207.1 efflux RND transporter periplasmic adaptor subunit [Alkalicaulis satelles]